MKATHYQYDYDVIISGAGPVGLFLACELAGAPCKVLVVEKAVEAQSPLKRLPFGIRGLTAPTIDVLQSRGLLDELSLHKRMKNPHASPPAGSSTRQAGHFAGIPFYESDIDTSRWQHTVPDGLPFSLLAEMQELETILTRRAEKLGITILRGMPITDLEQNDQRVTVRAGSRHFDAQWLVGCDGSRSIVRKTAGFEFAGTEPEFTGYSALIDMADAEKLKPGRNITSTGMYLQSQPGYVIIQDFDGGAFHDSGMPVSLEHLQQVLRRISQTDVTITALRLATTWTDRARQATTYRKGRILLAGDAAHIHAPLGGQGLNLGLGDAANLGWKLAATIRDEAHGGLLDTYQSERHPVGEKVLEWSRAQVALMMPSPGARALRSIVEDIMRTRDGATYFAGRVWGINANH